MNGLILLPTLNRVELLKNFVKSYVETHACTTVWVLVDDKDFEANKVEYEIIIDSWPLTFFLLKTGDKITMGDKVRRAYPLISPEIKWIGLLNDDHYCVTPEWDKKVEAMIDGTNMVSTNDGFWNFGFRVVGLTAWSMPLLKAVGFPIFPDGLDHLYIDDIWKALGESTGCWIETMKINIEHRHVYAGKSPEDETFRKVNSQEDYQKGLKVFQKFMEQDFKDTCKRVLELRSSNTFKNKFV